jgi:hypothetical protein
VHHADRVGQRLVYPVIDIVSPPNIALNRGAGVEDLHQEA